MKEERTVRFSVSLEEGLAEKLQQLLDERSYTNRSEAIRDLIRASLVEEEWRHETGEIVGVLTLVYDHHTRDLSQRLNAIQHEFFQGILSSTHVHLDLEHCLEVIILRGPAAQVQEIANRLISIRGVRHGKLIATTTGKDLP